jgi:DNA-binding GntR family transcriptional regulator
MTKKDHAYRQLRGSLLGGELRPGARLLEVPLARQLGVSRIPLREAIDQLASEGLVDRQPGLGSYVRSLTPEQLRQMYEMREVLECYVTEKAAFAMTGSQLGRLDDLYWEISGALRDYRSTGKWTAAIRDRLVQADLAFHQTIAHAAGNEPIRKEIERLQAVAAVVSYRPELAKDEMAAMTRSASQHLAIVRALRARRGAEAKKLMAEHLHHARDRALLVVQSAAHDGN